MKRIQVLQRVLASNDALAEAQQRELDAAGVLGINIMSAPGSGKTTLVERTVAALKNEYRIQVIEGDIQGDLDARRVLALGVPCLQINTQGDCHIDSLMLASVIPQLDLKNLDLLLVENVGNLVCPAEFRLPTHYNVTILSTPEGSDKPIKYPLMFTKSDLLLVNKIDLLPHVTFDFPQLARAIRRIKPKLPIYQVSTKTGAGLEQWFGWLRSRLEHRH
ncbi:MAG: hydrogenase nickel incorporation protein HypB [candidate division WOR-3 bacterium]